MRRIAYIFVVLGLVLCVVSCKKKEETEDIVVDKIVEKPQNGPIVMKNQESKGQAKWISDALYTYMITRAADSTDVVTNHDNDYRDNRITLVVNRLDGTEFFKKTFSKKNFENVLPKEFLKSGILTNMSFDNVEGNEMHFIVTVGSPDENNEDYFLVRLTLDKMGNTSASEYHEPPRTE